MTVNNLSIQGLFQIALLNRGQGVIDIQQRRPTPMQHLLKCAQYAPFPSGWLAVAD
jgi:hypothetical protein